MERLKKRLEVAKKALMTLQELENKPESKMRRDATIQRFEYSFEAMWKAAKQYLNDIEGLDLGSPGYSWLFSGGIAHSSANTAGTRYDG